MEILMNNIEDVYREDGTGKPLLQGSVVEKDI